MKISGIVKTSMIDYPEHIVTTLFTSGCNLNCPYCHNSELINNNDNEGINIDQILNFLEGRKKVLDGVCITGGEPTLQSNLKNFIITLKNMGLKIKLDTNGTNPEVIQELLKDQLIDYIAMDLKAHSSNQECLTGSNKYINQIKKSIKIIQNNNIDYEFRTTVVPNFHNNKDIEKIVKLIKGSKQYYIQNFKPQNTLDKDLLNINSFPEKKLKEFKKIANKYISNVQIRN
jgi:pyruvate formate lyase activating enzyme